MLMWLKMHCSFTQNIQIHSELFWIHQLFSTTDHHTRMRFTTRTLPQLKCIVSGHIGSSFSLIQQKKTPKPIFLFTNRSINWWLHGFDIRWWWGKYRSTLWRLNWWRSSDVGKRFEFQYINDWWIKCVRIDVTRKCFQYIIHGKVRCVFRTRKCFWIFSFRIFIARFDWTWTAREILFVLFMSIAWKKWLCTRCVHSKTSKCDALPTITDQKFSVQRLHGFNDIDFRENQNQNQTLSLHRSFVFGSIENKERASQTLFKTSQM